MCLHVSSVVTPEQSEQKLEPDDLVDTATSYL